MSEYQKSCPNVNCEYITLLDLDDERTRCPECNTMLESINIPDDDELEFNDADDLDDDDDDIEEDVDNDPVLD